MSVVLYFGFMGMVVLVGFVVLGVTFRQWYLESRSQGGQEEA